MSDFTISTWNVLADCYVHGQPRSTDTQNDLTDAGKKISDTNPIAWKNRSQLIGKCIRECNTDVLCFQEVDHYHDFYKNLLKELGYRPCFVQRPNRQDGCVIAFKSSKFTLIDLLNVNCDDSICADSLYEHQKYLKHNVALFLRLRCVETSKDIIIATCHIHWNPLRPEVKVSQIAYILQQLKDFQGEDGKLGAVPVVLTGDFNTLPADPIYRTLTDPLFNQNNNVAALNNMLHNLRYGGEFWDNGVPASSTKHRNATKWQWTSPTAATTAIATPEPSTESASPATTESPPPPETLSETPTPPLTSASTAATTANDAKERHRAQFPISGDPTYAARITSINTFFARAEREKRVILTTSRSLRERASCSKSFFIQAQKLEQGLIDIAVNFGLNLSRDRFLTVCGKCGDDVEEVNRTIDIENNTCIIHDERLEDKYMPIDRAVFACVNCAQPYWWNEKAGSLPALAMERAEQLYLMVCQGIEKRENKEKNGATDGSAEVKVVESIVTESTTVGGVVATPTIYRQDECPVMDKIDTVSKATPVAGASPSPTNGHQKAIVKAGTCILKDFGRTAKNPTLKNLAINSDSIAVDEANNGHNRVGSRSNSKSAELELEVSRQLAKVSLSDSPTEDDKATSGDSTTTDVTSTTGKITPATKTSAVMSMEELSQMFENRERNVKLARENSGGSSNAGELIRGDKTSVKSNGKGSAGSLGLPLLSVYQLAAKNKNEDNNGNACSNSAGENAEPELTNWNGEFKGTLDYIFVSENVQLVSPPAVLPTVVTTATAVSSATGLVSENVLTQVITTPQPSRLWPSDHFIVTTTLHY
eukprot:gene8881-10498_t